MEEKNSESGVGASSENSVNGGNNESSGSMFSITPMSTKMMLKGGDVYEGVLKVFTPVNMEGDFHYKVDVAPYNVTGTDYEADLTKQTNRSQIMNWITIDEPKGVLGPNETREIHYTVTVPEDAPGGGQYAVILVGSDEEETAASDGMLVQNVYEMASVLYAQVSGDIKRDGKIELNEVPGFITTTPMWVKVQLENNGNIHESAKIDISVKNFLNGAQVYPSDGEEGWLEEVIMPETTRVATREIKEMPALGIYEVTQSVDYMGEHSSVTQIVVACPIWFMIMVAVVIGIIVAGIVMSVRKHKKKKALKSF